MKRTLFILSLMMALTVAVFGQTSAASQKQAKRLSKQQLNSLIATAKTPAEHQRVAQYFEAQAQDYRAQAEEHEAMIAAYKANSSLSTNKNFASMIGHCQYFVARFKEMAVKSHELAQLHEQMAKDASQAVPAK